VAILLEAKGYEQYVPWYKVRDHRPAGRIDAEVPLFPHYVFCRVKPASAGLIVSTPGVIRIVGAGSTPIPVLDEEIEAIRRVLDSHLPVEALQSYRIGQPIEIRTGPLSGLRGTLTRYAGRDRLVVSVSLLQRAVAVDIAASWVVPLRSTSVTPRQTYRDSMRPC
jgi:transcription antitermination factor NusG